MYIPAIWKIAIVQPLPKEENPSNFKDLRLISILPCLSKVLEMAISKQLADLNVNLVIHPDRPRIIRLRA